MADRYFDINGNDVTDQVVRNGLGASYSTSGVNITPLRSEVSGAINPKVFGNATTPISGPATGGVSGGGSSGSQGGYGGGGYTQASAGQNYNPSSGGGGMDIASAVFSAVDKVFTNILGVADQIRNWNALETSKGQFKQEFGLKQKAFELQKQTTRFNQALQQAQLGIAQGQFGLQKATTGESLAGAGQARFQSAVAFNESQKDRRRSLGFLKGMSQGIAEGLATRPSNARLQQPGQAAQQSTLTPTLTNPGA